MSTNKKKLTLDEVTKEIAAIKLTVNHLIDQMTAVNATIIGIAIESNVKLKRTLKLNPDTYKEFLVNNVKPIANATEALSARLYFKEHGEEKGDERS